MRKFLLTLLIATAITVGYAQKGHYLYGNLGGGLHNLNYKIGDNGKKKPGYGFSGELGWQWFFSEHFGVGLGAKFNTISTTSKLNYTQSNDNYVDRENGLQYTANTVFNDLKELDKQKVFDFPLTFYYQKQLAERWRFLAGLSGIYTVVLSQNYESTGGNLSTGKYFPDYGLDYSGLDDKEHGIVTVSDFSGDTKLKTTQYGIGANLQALYVLKNNPNVEFTFGLYGIYRFSDQRQGNVYDVFNDKTLEYNGVTQSNILDKISSANVGASVGLRFRLGKKDKVNNIDEPDEIVYTEPDTLQNQPKEEVVVADNTLEETTPADNTLEETTPADNKVDLAKVLFDNAPIYFEINSSKVDKESQSRLDNIADALKNNPDVKILVTGHTCNLGSLEVNKRVGKNRANSVKSDLISRGVNAEQIQTETRWYSQPLVPNTSEANRKKNRRVEFEILK